MRIAIVSDFLFFYSGAEKVVESLLNIWPEADVLALTDHLSDERRKFLRGKKVATSFIQKLPFASRYFRAYLPLWPLAIEQLDCAGYDVVISVSHSVAKGIVTAPEQLHICLCCSPIRYAWDMEMEYLVQKGRSRGPMAALMRYFLHRIRMWDVTSAARVDEFIAISNFIGARIRKYYRRESTVIYPPVDVDHFDLMTQKEDFYVTASRLVPYKMVPLIVQAFKQMPARKLVVFGDGPDYEAVLAAADGAPNISVRGYQSSDVLREHMQKAKAFVYAAKEDFGIVMLEAQACGTPVIAFDGGAAHDTVRVAPLSDPTGVLFSQQTPESICDAVEAFEAAPPISALACRAHAEKFSVAAFGQNMRAFVDAAWKRHQDACRGTPP